MSALKSPEQIRALIYGWAVGTVGAGDVAFFGLPGTLLGLAGVYVPVCSQDYQTGAGIGGLVNIALLLASFGADPAADASLAGEAAGAAGEAGADTPSFAGAGGDWPRSGEMPDPNTIRQETTLSCVSACGEMLLRSRKAVGIVQADLRAAIEGPKGADLADLARELNKVDPTHRWAGGTVPEAALDALNARAPWIAELKQWSSPIGHAVIVDGVDEAGNIVIRDPFDATTYTMTRDDFTKTWTTRAVFQN